MAIERNGVARCALLGLLILAGCAQVRTPTTKVPKPDETITTPKPDETVAVPDAPPIEDPMTVHRTDQPLLLAKGELERIDCLSGTEDLHARMALEARGGQVTNFAYYSRWNFRTCSISLDQRNPQVRWRLTEDGATRVQTPHGSFLIRADAEHYRFEFRNVERMKFCGMYGRISGEMVIKRRSEPPQCEAWGILDR